MFSGRYGYLEDERTLYICSIAKICYEFALSRPHGDTTYRSYKLLFGNRGLQS